MDRSDEPRLGRRTDLAVQSGTPSLTEQAYRQLRKDIVQCRLAPGSEVSEIDLADMLSMSKTPVREALVRLQFEGLVRAMPRRGYQIVPVTITDVNEMFELRIIIERAAAEMAATNADAATLAELDRLAHSNSLDLIQEDIDYQDTVNFRFHTLIALASGNSRLHRLAVQQFTELERIYFMEATAEQEYPTAPVTHVKIVEALQSRDPTRAATAAAGHIEASRDLMLAVLTQPRSRARLQIV